MPQLEISIATGDYDRVRAIKDGRVRVEGCAVTYLTPPLEELFIRAFMGAEFDACEISLSSYLIALSRGKTPYRALPVFLCACSAIRLSMSARTAASRGRRTCAASASECRSIR